MRAALVLLALGAGCIDREGALAEFCRVNHPADCPDAGTGGGTAGGTAGGGPIGGGSGGGFAGGTGGGTAGGSGGGAGGSVGGGGGSGGAFDGGPPCPGSTSPRLRCSVMGLQDSGFPGSPWLAVNDAGFLAAWAETAGHRVEVRQITTLLSVSTLLSEPTTGSPRDVAVAGAGGHWAAVWRDDVDLPTRCASSKNTMAMVVDSGTMLRPGRQAVAVSESGAVGIGALPFFSTDAVMAQSTSGCPAEFDGRYYGAYYSKGVGVLHRAQTDEFIYTLTGYEPGTPGFGEVHLFHYDGGFRQRVGVEALADHVSALSADGDFVQVVTANLGMPTGFGLRSIRADFSTSIAQTPGMLSADPYWWSNASCGTDCFAIAWLDQLPNGTDARVKIALTDELSSPRAGGPYDLICSVPKASTAVGVAYSGGTLGVLVTNTRNVELWLCDLPP